MTGLALRVSDISCRKSAARFTTGNAWAKHVRNRWPVNTLAEMLREWPRLSEGQARGVIYGHASTGAIEAIYDSLSRSEAFWLSVEILCERLGTNLEEQIALRAAEARRAQELQAANERHWAALGSRLAEPRVFVGISEDAPLGGPEGEGAS